MEERRARKEALLQRFESHTAVPMVLLALAIIPLLAVPLLFDLSPRTEATIFALDWIIWALFAVEYGVRFYLAPRKWAFVKSNKIDLVVIVLPFLRPLRVIRSARLLRLLSATRVTAFLGRAIVDGRSLLTRHQLHYVLAVTLVVIAGAAFMVEAFERGATDANITSIPDALWWAITTVTTVGYGDRFPTTAPGRGVGVVLMILGIALFGFLAGNLASLFLERGKDTETDQNQDVADRLDRIEKTLRRIEAASISEGRPDQTDATRHE